MQDHGRYEMDQAADGRHADELVESAAAFIQRVVLPRERDPRIGAHGPSDALVMELRAEARACGVLAAHLPPALGGFGLSYRQTAAYFDALGYSLLGPLAANCAAPDEGNMHLLERIASPTQKTKYLEPLAQGLVRSAFYMTEPDGGAGADPSLLATTASRVAGGWVLKGRKWLITGADGAAFGIVMARAPEGATLFLVDQPSEGLIFERILDTIDRTMPGGHAVVLFDDVRVSDDQVLGEVGEGFRYAQQRLAPARLTHCMRWLGAARRAHDIAANYALRRHAFGKALIDHEGVGFMLADNEIDLRQARLMVDWCAQALDNGERGAIESSMAKVAVSEALFRVADRCVQILGGLGVTDDTPVHQIFRDLRAFRIYDGPSEVHRWAIARDIKRRLTPG